MFLFKKKHSKYLKNNLRFLVVAVVSIRFFSLSELWLFNCPSPYLDILLLFTFNN